jgi:hypothetical protein
MFNNSLKMQIICLQFLIIMEMVIFKWKINIQLINLPKMNQTTNYNFNKK